MPRLLLLFLFVILIGVSCDKPIRSGALIDAYRTAACVVPGFANGIEPPTRGWDAEIAIAGGSKARVTGADVVGGDIRIRYERDGQEMVAVDPGGLHISQGRTSE
jgi:hypothetical protein